MPASTRPESGLGASGGCNAVDDVGERGDDDLAVLPPDDRLLGRADDARDLTDRHSDAVARGDSQVRVPVERRAFGRNGASDDVDALLADP